MSADLANAINSIFIHPNVGPFHCQAVDPEARDEQPFTAIRPTGGKRVQ
jgi:hypothetical protein